MPPQSRGYHRTPVGVLSSDVAPGGTDSGHDHVPPLPHLAGNIETDIEPERMNIEQMHDENLDTGSDSQSSGDQDSASYDSSEKTSAQVNSSKTGMQGPSNHSIRPSLTPRSRSYSPAAFAPPFYNRPPTPLPPSPSLTSLLRPRQFSAPRSHPTTPESSDTEGTGAGNRGLTSTAAAAVHPARSMSTASRAIPKVPTYEYYGFVVYVGSSLAFLMYLLWSYLPTPFLHQLGIYYYPNRWWSLAVPAWLVVAVLYVYVALAAWNTGVMTLPLSSLECFVDDKAQVAVVDANGRILSSKEKEASSRTMGNGSTGSRGLRGVMGSRMNGNKDPTPVTQDLDWRTTWSMSTDAVMDIPIGGVCEVLYGSGRDPDHEAIHG